MGAIEISVIVIVAAFALGMIVAMIVRKLKGKPSMGSDCGGCPYCNECNGNCGRGEDVKSAILEAKRRREQSASEQTSSEPSDDDPA